MFVRFRQTFTHIYMGMPIIIEYGSLADGAIFVRKLKDLDANFLMER